MSDEPDAAPSSGEEGTFTVLLALAANVAVGVLKLAAGLISGSRVRVPSLTRIAALLLW